MVRLRESAIRPLHILERRAPREPEDLVWIPFDSHLPSRYQRSTRAAVERVRERVSNSRGQAAAGRNDYPLRQGEPESSADEFADRCQLELGDRLGADPAV